MMGLLGLFAFLIAFTIIPVMIGARLVGARNTGLGAAFLAVLVLTGLSKAIEQFVADDLLAFVLAAVTGAIALAWILGTTFYRGVGVGLVVLAIQVVGAILLAALFPELSEPIMESLGRT